MLSNKIIGDFGEKEAVQFLKKKRYKILDINYKTPHGEIDIIAKHKEYFVFIEVKTRSSQKFGEAIEAVNKKKQLTIQKVANIYLNGDLENNFVRFDVIEVYVNIENNFIRISSVNHIENAYWG